MKMKIKYLTNARIIDPKNNIDEIGGLIIDTNGLIKAIGKSVNKNNQQGIGDSSHDLHR